MGTWVGFFYNVDEGATFVKQDINYDSLFEVVEFSQANDGDYLVCRAEIDLEYNIDWDSIKGLKILDDGYSKALAAYQYHGVEHLGGTYRYFKEKHDASELIRAYGITFV
jgi:hypothetical protein